MPNTNHEKIIRNCYSELIGREPDEDGLNHFLALLKSNSIDENGIKNQLKNSSEYSSYLLSQKYTEVVRRCFLEVLDRPADDAALNKFIILLKSNSIDENGIKNQLKNSSEYKLSYPVEIESNVSIDIKMKKEWDARTKIDLLHVIATGYSKNEDGFWNSGIIDCKKILGENEKRNSKDFFRFWSSKITKNNEPTKMQILEIGCGIGRILIPMSKIFGQTIGVDISSEMVKLGQKYTENIPNCKILESNGLDLSLFPENHFDFCYSYIVFQHIPEKHIVEQYIKEVSRILKPNCLFRFQVRGTISTKPHRITTWDGVQFNSKEIHELAKKNNFEIIEESNDDQEHYLLTFKSKK